MKVYSFDIWFEFGFGEAIVVTRYIQAPSSSAAKANARKQLAEVFEDGYRDTAHSDPVFVSPSGVRAFIGGAVTEVTGVPVDVINPRGFAVEAKVLEFKEVS
jgi:hypothetical protein